jgi:ABC-type multidrug transport system fused ATPase/permease subunit
VERVARLAGIHDFILTLPQGYLTRVGERGLALSAGQRQRIAIARALLQDSAVLVLDEATSALDGETERSIADALLPLLRDRTTLILSHRFPLVAKADRVLVLERGRVVQDGTTAGLSREEGTFQRLFQSEAPAR